MTAAAIEPDEIGRQLWATASSADSIAVDWVGEVFRLAAHGRPDLALQAATSGPTITTIDKEHSA
ncbi:hypothetical protein BJF87_04090 [Gordonia sp. CNJ-863]|uniref:hypothetical protein n=1 Tax=Gordonia sp. CNJ-863 TaxID=1904963 RepID=UPI00096593B3|nr:hypothetical protein [Gordonia sp. CNJ-863]OLT47431.1 hypothetical protein BJF87_04090 [Gordonia sp. CNJ-863]